MFENDKKLIVIIGSGYACITAEPCFLFHKNVTRTDINLLLVYIRARVLKISTAIRKNVIELI